MLTLIHGDDINKSRQFFISIKQKYSEAVPFDGQNISLTMLKQQLEGGELFTESKTLFIEHFIVKKKTSGDYKDIISYLLSQISDATIVLWEGKELDAKTLTLFKGSTIRLFKLPQSLFAFLDSIKPNNSKQTLQLFHQTLETVDVDAAFYMLIRHFRILLALSGGKTVIDEVKRIQDWQQNKLIKQAKLFTSQQLYSLYNNLFEIESAYKTGLLSSSLTSSIDIFLLGV